MPLYTGKVDDGLEHKSIGLTRYLTVSRLSDNSGRVPEERLWKHDKHDLFDIWSPKVAPRGSDVNELYKEIITWETFSKRYSSKLQEPKNAYFLNDIVRAAFEHDHDPDRNGIVLQCVCYDYRTCHRSLLAEEIKKRVDDTYHHSLDIIHL